MRTRSFDLFRSFNDESRRHQLLTGLPYGELIDQAAREYHLDSLLLAAIIRRESGFDPQVVSSRGALGLMQIMPETATLYGAPDPLDPGANLRAGAHYFRDLLELYQGDLELALAAYNAGPGTIARYGGMPPFRETSRYVDDVLATYVGYHRRLWRDTAMAELLRAAAPTPPPPVAVLASSR